jgi:hypothetical protein
MSATTSLSEPHLRPHRGLHITLCALRSLRQNLGWLNYCTAGGMGMTWNCRESMRISVRSSGVMTLPPS